MTAKTNDEWSRPINLGPSVNHDWHDSKPTLTPDGTVMYFTRCCSWHLVVTGRVDSEAAIRHMADIYAHGDQVLPGRISERSVLVPD